MTSLETPERIVAHRNAPAVLATDQQALYPRPDLDVLAQAGLLGLFSAKVVVGLQGTIAYSAQIVLRIAQNCPSTAMAPASDVQFDHIGTARCDAAAEQQAQPFTISRAACRLARSRSPNQRLSPRCTPLLLFLAPSPTPPK